MASHLTDLEHHLIDAGLALADVAKSLRHQLADAERRAEAWRQVAMANTCDDEMRTVLDG